MHKLPIQFPFLASMSFLLYGHNLSNVICYEVPNERNEGRVNEPIFVFSFMRSNLYLF